MNAVQVSELKAGHDLDALIAEKVFGWKNVHEHSFGNAGMYWVGDSPRGTMDRLPRYSKEISEAWRVVETLENHPMEYLTDINRISNEGTKETLVWAARIRAVGSERYIYVDAETVPLAICRAALLAV